MPGEPGAAVVLLSGGLDSGTAALLWQEAGGSCARALFVDYGQRAALQEAEASQRLARRHGWAWRHVPLPQLAEVARAYGSALLAGTRELPRGTLARPGDAASARAVWVPARNVVLVALAAAHAEALGATAVVAGFNREEAATFGDNSAEFLARMTAVLELGTRSAVRVESPTLHLDKPAIAAHARRLGHRATDFWSCYADGAEPCGVCESCLRARRAWEHGPA